MKPFFNQQLEIRIMGIFTDFLTDVAYRVGDIVDFVKANPMKITAVVVTTVATGGTAVITAAGATTESIASGAGEASTKL